MRPPLSERLRPSVIDEVVGHEKLIGEKGWIRHLIESNKPLSFLLFGPPGSGKTTIARLYGKSFPDASFFSISAVSSTISDVRKILSEKSFFGQKTILFIDEIHRFNRAQQDLFLPYLEDGSLILIAATTENPSFAINNALLSRLRVLEIEALDDDAIDQILIQYENKTEKKLSPDLKKHLSALSKGDARHLLNLLENLEEVDTNQQLKNLEQFLHRKSALYDRDKEGHYNLISALHKSIRGSDPDAALYWLSRMLKGGEDPKFLARRIIRMAVEDIGLADPSALRYALDAHEMYTILGSPEGELGLAQAVIYLALAPKSNKAYLAMKKATAAAENTSSLNPPKKILNAPTKLMKEMGNSEGYIYDHDTEKGFSGQNYFPDQMNRENYYQPEERGFEREMKKRLTYFEKLRSELNS